MHRISLAPVLSATRSRDSCWITSTPSRGRPGSLGLLEDLDQPPALGGRQRTGLHQLHPVTDPGGVGLVVRFDLCGGAQHLAVQRMLLAVLQRHYDRLIHLVRNDVTLSNFPLIPLLIVHAAPSLPATASGDTDRPSSRSCITV